MCPVCTTAAFLLDQHYAGFDNVADIIVSCLLIFPEMPYVCCYLAKKIPAHVIVALREKRWKPSPMAFAVYFNSTPLRMTLWARMGNFCMSGLAFLKNGLTFSLLRKVQKSFRKDGKDLGAFPCGKSAQWGRALSNTVRLGESCCVQLRCFTQMSQSSFTGAESETDPKTAGLFAWSTSPVPQSDLDGRAILVPGSRVSARLLLPWPQLLVWSPPHTGEASLDIHISLHPAPPNRSLEGSYCPWSP